MNFLDKKEVKELFDSGIETVIKSDNKKSKNSKKIDNSEMNLYLELAKSALKQYPKISWVIGSILVTILLGLFQLIQLIYSLITLFV